MVQQIKNVVERATNVVFSVEGGMHFSDSLPAKALDVIALHSMDKENHIFAKAQDEVASES